MLMETPPHVGSKKPADLWDLGKLAWKLRSHVDEATVADITRLFTMSATELLERWFESPEMKGFMAVNGIIGTWAGPDAPGTAYVLMHHSVGDIGDGQVASWGFMEGGMGAVSKACEESAKFFGAEVRVERAGPDDHHLERPRHRRRARRRRGGPRRRSSSPPCIRRSRSCSSSTAPSCRARSCTTSSTGRPAAAR